MKKEKEDHIVRTETIPLPTTEESLEEGADLTIIKVATMETEMADRAEIETLERETTEEKTVPEMQQKTDEKGHIEMKGSKEMGEMSLQGEKVQDEADIMMSIEILVWILFKKLWSAP